MTNPGSRAGLDRRRMLCRLALMLVLSSAGSLLPTIARAQTGDVRVQLSSPTVSLGESVRIAIVASDLDGELDASALGREFDVLRRSSSRDVQITNGRRRSTVTWVLELAPREVGVFTVPAVSVGGVASELVTLTVTEAPSGADRDVFVESSVDTTSPRVQSQVILTIGVFLGVDIVEGSLEEPVWEGFEVRRLGDDVRREEIRDGRRYAVTERRLALFPQTSGPRVIEPARLSVTVPVDGTGTRGPFSFFSPTRRLIPRTEPIALDVRPRPPGGSGWWLPAKAVTLEEDWRGGTGAEVRVGEPMTRTVRLRARGALDSQLPDIATPRVDGLSIYADDAARAATVDADGIESVLTLSLAVIPERPGTYELPPIAIDWFDVAAERMRTASLPARTLTVLPGDAGGRASDTVSGAGDAVPGPDDTSLPPVSGEAAGPAPRTVPTAGPDGVAADGAEREAAVAARWRTLAVGALAGWGITAAAFALSLWRRSRASASRAGDESGASDAGRPDTPTVRSARRRVERAVRGGDAGDLGRAVLERAALQSPDDPPRSLAALADRLDAVARDAGASAGDPAGDELVVAGALRRLESAIYGRGAGARLGTGELEPDAWPVRLERALGTLGDEAGSGRARVASARVGRALPPL